MVSWHCSHYRHRRLLDWRIHPLYGTRIPIDRDIGILHSPAEPRSGYSQVREGLPRSTRCAEAGSGRSGARAVTWCRRDQGT